MPLISAVSTFRLHRKCSGFPQWCYLHCVLTVNEVTTDIFAATHRHKR